MRDPDSPVTRARPSRLVWYLVAAIIVIVVALVYGSGLLSAG